VEGLKIGLWQAVFLQPAVGLVGKGVLDLPGCDEVPHDLVHLSRDLFLAKFPGNLRLTRWRDGEKPEDFLGE
jgi:hypothetical protein